MNTANMVHELAAIKSAIAIHEARIASAVDTAFDAAIAFEEAFGMSPWEAPEHAVGWSAADALATSLREEDGYFWALSRVRDLEILTGVDGRGQRPIVVEPTAPWSCGHVVGIGDMPKADPVVGPWMLAIFGLANAA